MIKLKDLLDEKCWKGYEKKGMKKMFGKMYPNCVKKEEKVYELIDMTVDNPTLLKKNDRVKKWNKSNNSVLVTLKKNKKVHYVWKKGDLKSINVKTLDGKKSMNIKPSDVHQVIELPHTGYVNKHPELKKHGFK